MLCRLLSDDYTIQHHESFFLSNKYLSELSFSQLYQQNKILIPSVPLHFLTFFSLGLQGVF